MMQINSFQTNSDDGDVSVSFSWHHQSPLWLAEDTRIPAETQGRHHDFPSILQEENHDDCFRSVTSHLLMENFKPELFSNKLAVS